MFHATGKPQAVIVELPTDGEGNHSHYIARTVSTSQRRHPRGGAVQLRLAADTAGPGGALLGAVARNRIQTLDATFGLERTDPITLHRETQAGMTTLDVPSQAAVPVFDDSDPNAYYDPADPLVSV